MIRRCVRRCPQAGVRKAVRNVQLPLGKDGGKNDLRAWIVEGHNYQDMDEYARTAPTIEPSEAAAEGIAPHEAILKNLGLVVLGEHEWSQRVEVFAENTKKSGTLQEVDRLTIAKLIQLIGREPVDKYVHDGRECPEDKFQLKDIKYAIASEASNKHYYAEDRYGAGVWDAGGQLVLVRSGEIGLLNGKGIVEKSHIPFYEGRVLDIGHATGDWYDLESLNRYLTEAAKPEFRQATMEEIVKILSHWHWRQRQAPVLAASLIICTFMQSIWTWRPMVFITGSSDTGKSTFMASILSEGIFGKLAMYVQKVTASAVCQFMRHHGRALLVDEFEKDKHRQDMLEMLRITSRGGSRIRGTANHEGIEFRLRHLPWLSSIETGLHKQPDRNRFIIFELSELPPEKRGKILEYIPSSQKLNQLGMKLLAIGLRAATEAKRLSHILQAQQVKTADGIDVPGRVVESFSVPCAMLSTILEQDDATAIKGLQLMLADWDFGTQSTKDEVELLRAILQGNVDMDRGVKRSVSSLLASIERNELGKPECQDALARVGLKRVLKRKKDAGEPLVVLFVDDKKPLQTILRGTEFEGHVISQYLMRLPGASNKHRQKLGGDHLYSGVEVPMSTIRELFGGDDDDAADEGSEFTEEGDTE